MPCCAASGCSNRSELGIRLYGFPADNNRRKLWEDNLKRDNWTSTPGSSKLCEVRSRKERKQPSPRQMGRGGGGGESPAPGVAAVDYVSTSFHLPLAHPLKKILFLASDSEMYPVSMRKRTVSIFVELHCYH